MTEASLTCGCCCCCCDDAGDSSTSSGLSFSASDESIEPRIDKESFGSKVGIGGVATLVIMVEGDAGVPGFGLAEGDLPADNAGEARDEFDKDFEIPTASTLAGLVGCCVRIPVVSGSVGGALDALGGSCLRPPLENCEAGTASN